MGRCGARVRRKSRLSEPATSENVEGRGRGTLLCLFAVLIWGAQFPIGKSALAVMDGFHASLIRYVIAAVILIALLAWTEGREGFRYYGRFGRVSLAGLLGFTLSGLCIFAGLTLTRPEHAAILIALQPALATLAAWAFWKRRPTRFALVAIAFAFIGVVLVVTKGDPRVATTRQELLGDLIVFVGGSLWVSYTMLSEAIRGWSTVRYTTLTVVPGTIGIVLITLALDLAGVIQPPTITQSLSVWPQLLYLGFGSLVLSMLAWTAGLRRIGAVNATLFTSLVPVVAFVIRAGQGVEFSAIEITGAMIVVGALIANNLHARRLAS